MAVPGEMSSSDGEIPESGVYNGCCFATPTCSQTTNEKLNGSKEKDEMVRRLEERIQQQSSDSRLGVILKPLPSNMCMACRCRPKTASIVHGGTGHQVCCFKCALRLKHQRKPCP
ncbi:E3 ubiquitin-protein ligase Mdm2-like, partial [Pecten maximus]|uniref:E3 ubiquitin-protein ligase Mdm2-like n=1 Tax=Pecten maximus TaxID=6579 RepID=UPI00145914B7